MPGIMGSKGEKGEKGESSVTGSAADQVPQTNWKQCVWKTTDGRDRGKVKVSFNESWFCRGSRVNSKTSRVERKRKGKKFIRKIIYFRPRLFSPENVVTVKNNEY